MLRFALRFVTYDKPKSIGVIIGIIISTFLIGQQTGIFLFLTGAMSALVDFTQADIWIVDSKTTNANSLGQIDVRVGYQVESISGVKKAYPLIVTGGAAKFSGGKTSPITLIGAQPPYYRGGPFRISKGELSDLIKDGAVSTDEFDRKNLNDATIGTNFEINGKRVQVALQTRGARGFGATYMFTTVSRARALGNVPNSSVSAFLIELEKGVDPNQVCEQINHTLFGVRAWTKQDLSKATVSTILGTSGIAFSVGTLIIFATISGMIIIGLTMYSAAVDRLRDYGTLKAIGANNRYIRNLILIQALFFAFMGYSIGILLLQGFRNGIAKTGVLFDYSLEIKIGFFIITMFISLGGAIFAMRRIGKLEPASVFRT